MNASAVNALNQVPLVNSTQILPTSTQVPIASQVVPTVSQVVPTTTPQVQSVVPGVVPEQQHYTTQTTLNTLVDEDYRLGRGILDDFRPNAYKTQIGVVGNTTTNVITSSTLPVNATPLVSTPVVTTPVVSTAPNLGGANALKEFL